MDIDFDFFFLVLNVLLFSAFDSFNGASLYLHLPLAWILIFKLKFVSCNQ